MASSRFSTSPREVSRTAEIVGSSGSDVAMFGKPLEVRVILDSGYMSPEQQEEEPLRSINVRYFSFGCILFEAVTGRKTFPGVMRSINSIRSSVNPRLLYHNPSRTPAWLQKIVRRCLEKDPDERYQWIKDVANDLKECATAIFSQRYLLARPPPANRQ